jgi:hypothetical protein
MAFILFTGAALTKSVHWEEVSDFFLALIIESFNNIGPNCILFGQKPMNNIVLWHFVINLVFRLLLIEQFENHGNIFLLHFSYFSNDIYSFLFRKSVPLLKLFKVHAVWEIRILDLNKFCSIDKSIHVMRGTKWCWHRVTWCIVCLRESQLSLSSHHFLDTNLGHTLVS